MSGAVCTCDDEALLPWHFRHCPVSVETDGWRYIDRDELENLNLDSDEFKAALYDPTEDKFYTVWGHSHLGCLTVHGLKIDNMLDLESGWAIRIQEGNKG